jgi:hypothetical protein
MTRDRCASPRRFCRSGALQSDLVGQTAGMGLLQGSSARWRVFLGGLAVVLLGMLTAALFTTFDSVAADDGDCGSPIAPAEEAPAGCDAELGHARATRTALLAWSIPCLAAMWFVESRGRSVASRTIVGEAPPPSLQHGVAAELRAHRAATGATQTGGTGEPGFATTYPRSERGRVTMQGSTTLFAVIGLVVAVAFVWGRLAGDPMPPIGVALFMTVWVVGTWAFAFNELFVQPTAIVTTQEVLRFDARWRQVEVAWTDLIEVRSPANDPNRQAAVWKWAGGKRRTWTTYDGWHRLLNEVELRAPHASIKGF